VANGTVITVFSPKGGTGTSMVACNLAIVLARRAARPAVLVDGDFEFGDVAVMLKIAPRSTVIDLISSLGELARPFDVQAFEGLLTRHQSGLLVVPAPADPASFDRILPFEVLDILDALAAVSQCVVVDTASQFSEHTLAILDRSDHVVLVAALDVPSIKNAKLALQTFRLLGIPTERVHLVLNRADSKVKLEVSEVQRMLRFRAGCLVPSDVAVPRSVNRGTPLVSDAPRSGVARAIEAFADRFVPVPVHANGRRT
jgi:pilus assembly protein CpaE